MRCTILFILLSIFSLVEAATFRAPMSVSRWEVQAGKTQCWLTHQIDDMRRAGFLLESGEPLQFFLHEGHQRGGVDKASLFVDPAPWQHKLTYQQEYQVFWRQHAWNTGKLVVYGHSAEDVLASLSKGQEPVFSLLRADKEARVEVSSIRFYEPYQQFRECRQALFPFGKRQLEHGHLFFNSRQSRLSEDINQRLIVLSAYLQEMGDKKVAIVDKTQLGSKQTSWFKKRSAQIRDKLVKLGISKDRVLIPPKPATTKENIVLQVFGPDDLMQFYYRKGNTRLTQREKQKLALLAEYIKLYRSKSNVVISSHTDSKGSRASNLKVSKARGETIKNYLHSQGVDETKILVKAYGESRPLKSNRFPTGRSQNRRAIISLVN